jgi:hypothetical protein
MKSFSSLSKPVTYSALALGISAITLSAITLAAIYSKFDGVIQFKLGSDGGQVLIDGRSQQAK